MHVRPLTKNDYEELSVFLEGQTHGIISRDVWRDRFPCFWENNPFLKEGSDQRGWLIIDNQERVGGFFGSIPMLYQYEGQERIVDVASSWYVEPSCRRYSIAIFRAFLKQGRPQICTTPSPEVTFIFKKMGFQSFEAEWLEKAYCLPIDSWEFSYFLRYRLFKNKVALAVSAVVMPVLTCFVDFYKLIYKARLAEKNGRKYFVREIDAFGGEYDVFWEKFRLKFDVLAVRNQKTLNWLFFGTPQLKSQRKVLEIRKKQELIGYVAVKEVVRSVGAHRHIRYYEMADAAFLEDNSELFSDFLDELKSLAYKNHISFIKIPPLFSSWSSMMRQKGFMKMLKEFRFIYKDLAQLSRQPRQKLAGSGIVSRCFEEPKEKKPCPSRDGTPQNLKSWLTPIDGDRGFF